MLPCPPTSRAARHLRRGFTLLELMIVVAMLAVVASMATLALRDSNASKLEEEAGRLSALLEGARAQSRTLGVEVRWLPQAPQAELPGGFAFQGLPEGLTLPTLWLDPRTRAQVLGAPLLRLGPEPLIGAQKVLLSLEDKQLLLSTDGMGPFVVTDTAAAQPGAAVRP